MPKLVKYTLIALACLLILGLMVPFGINTGFGRGTIKDIAVSQLEKSLGGEVEIAAIEPGLPNHIRLRNVRLDDDFVAETGPFFEADSIEIKLNILSLLRGQTDIQLIRVTDSILHRLPESGEAPTTEKSSGLPNLPEFRLDRMEIQQFSIAQEIVGKAISFNADGAFRHINHEFEVTFNAQSQDGQDNIALDTLFDVNSWKGKAKGEILSTEDGFLSTLINSDGPINLTIQEVDTPRGALQINGSAGPMVI